MFTRKISKLLISAALSIVSGIMHPNVSAGELSSKATAELIDARLEYIRAYQSLLNKSKQIEQLNTSAPNAILNLTSSVESLKKDLSKQCEVDCRAIADSHNKMMTAKLEEKKSSLQRKIDEISNRFFGEAAREARWSQAREEVSHHFPNIEQEVIAEVQRKYGADFERAIAEARSAIQEEFSGVFGEYQEALIAEYDRRFSQVVGELNARLTNEINQIQNESNNEIHNIERSCNADQEACYNKWQATHRQRLEEIESWFKRRWDEIVNNAQMTGGCGQQVIQSQIQGAQTEAANAHSQSYESCQIQCNNEIESIISSYKRRADEVYNRGQQKVSHLHSDYQSVASKTKEELNQSLQQELDVYAEALGEQFSQKDLNSPEMQRIADLMSKEAQEQIGERCELLIRRCFLDKEAQDSDLCQNLIAAEKQNTKMEWEQFYQEAEQKCLAQIANTQDSYQKRLKDAEARLYGTAGKIFEEYNQAQIAANEARKKFEEKGQKLVDAQAQEPTFMDELDEMEETEKTPSLLQALKEALVNGFKNAIPIWTPTRDAISAMDAMAAAAIAGRYEDIDENFNKLSQELVNLMRDTNDARYGFVIKPMMFDFLTKFVTDFKEKFGSYPLNYMWSGEFVSAARFKKERLPLAKTPEAIGSIHKAAQIIEKYEIMHKREMWWKETGFPDFEPYTKISELGKVVKVEITVTGNRKADNRLAATKAYETGVITKNEMEALIQPYKAGFVWHHVEDAKTMLLVPRDLHAVFKHTGGVFAKTTNEKIKK